MFPDNETYRRLLEHERNQPLFHRQLPRPQGAWLVSKSLTGSGEMTRNNRLIDWSPTWMSYRVQVIITNVKGRIQISIQGIAQ